MLSQIPGLHYSIQFNQINACRKFKLHTSTKVPLLLFQQCHAIFFHGGGGGSSNNNTTHLTLVSRFWINLVHPTNCDLSPKIGSKIYIAVLDCWMHTFLSVIQQMFFIASTLIAGFRVLKQASVITFLAKLALKIIYPSVICSSH